MANPFPKTNEGPLIDLHLHLDGAVTTDIARKLASLQNIELPAADDDALSDLLSVPAGCQSLNDFLKCFALPLSLMQTREGIREAVRLVQENIRSQGVLYAEIRFAPQLHREKGLSQRQVIEAALEGLTRSPLFCNLILCCMRGEPSQVREANLETVRLAGEFLVRHGGVVAVDLAGAEALYPTSDYAGLFELASSLGIPCTIHAGEADGPESIRAALSMGARRIGHGTRAFQDPALIGVLCARGVTLEMCPTSNRQTRAVSDMRLYPLRRYLDAGLRVTINTDDMAISRITLADEFRYIRQMYDVTEKEKRRMLMNSVDAAFTDPATKEYLKKQFT